MGMGILLRSAIDPKVVGIFIVVVFIVGICMGPKGSGESGNGGGNRNNQNSRRKGVETKDLKFNPANTMQGHNNNKRK